MIGVRVSNEELRTVRDGMRELNRLVDALERGEAEKFVLTRHNRMRAVLLPFERYARLDQLLVDLGRQGYMTGGIERELLELARQAAA